MKNLLTRGRILLLPMCLGYVGAVAAQSLGTPTAEVWMGRSLEMSVPARFASPDAECVHADVFFGENRVRSGLVRASVVGPEGRKRIRVQTDALIDEPIVTVSVRAGCTSTVTRNYTLLPELPTEAVIAASNQPAFAAAVAAAPLRAATATAPAAGPRVRARPPRPVVAQAVQRPPQPPAPPARSARAFRRDAPPAGPRLRLEPLEFEQQAALRVSTSLAQPAGDASQRATAALLWQAINADPQELLRTSAMLQKLEADLVQLRQSSTQTRAEMAALRRRLDQAQPWYASPLLAQLLLLLVLVAGTTAGLMWFRARRAGVSGAAWYAPVAPHAAGSAREPGDEVVEMEPVVPAVASPLPAAGAAVVRAAGAAPAEVRSGGPGPIDFELPEKPVAARRGPSGAQRVETLAATLDEAEFLSSVGLTGDAMDVLKAYLQDSTGPAPVAFLELMRLCAQAGDDAAVAMVRRRYEKTFGMEPPRLEHVDTADGLDTLPGIATRISAAWGRPESMALIEELLFEPPAPGTVITPQAGRDLVALHAVASRLGADGEGSASAGDAAAGHLLAPWANVDDPAAALAAAQASADADGGHHFALDVDLAAAPEALPETQGSREDLKLAPLLAEMKEQAAREAQRRARQQEEDAFSAAVSSERMPVSRY